VKIAVMASPVTPLRPAQAGGAQSMITDIAEGMARRGHDVRLYCSEGSDVRGVRMITVPVPRDAAAALVMPGGPPPPVAPGVNAAIRAMLESVAASDIDVLSQHAFDAVAFELADGLPVLHTLHLPPLVPAVVDAARAVGALQLATVSETSRRAWQAAGISVGRVLRNGVAELEVADQPPQPFALVAGRISPEKGIEHALEAAARAGVQVRVAGALYDPSYALDLSNAQQLGVLTREHLRQVMAGSAVIICAVRWEEPFGLVAAEAQMAGCPVAAYRRGALPEVVEEGVSGFLAEPDDVSSLAAAIRSCMALDRGQVRASARRRLGLEAALDAYESALRDVALNSAP
jgi:glycosyltransferase involved in cell wall biosynthesis